jgi:hypothetical protein
MCSSLHGLFLAGNPLPALQTCSRGSGPATCTAIPSVLAMVLRAFLWLPGEEVSKQNTVPMLFLCLYMARVKASAPGPELILPLVEVGEEMALACELCNHPKATAIHPDFIDRLLEVGWSSVRRVHDTT